MTHRLAPLACALLTAVLLNGCGNHHVGSPPPAVKLPRPAAHAR